MASRKTPKKTPRKSRRDSWVAITAEHVFAEYEKGNTVPYKNVLDKLPDPTTGAEELTHLLCQLQGCVSRLASEHEALVRAILRVDWVERDAIVRGHYQALLVNFVSAQPIYLTRVLTTLVRHFNPQNPVPPPASSADVDGDHHKEQEEKFRMVHSTLQEVQRVVPLLPKYLLSVLGDNMPHARQSCYIQEWYIRNLLHVSRYLPELCQGILEIIIHRMLELDVGLPKDDVWEPDEREEADTPQFAMDGLDDEKVESSKDDEEKVKLSEKATKVDTLMCVLMVFLKESCFKNGEFLFEETKVLHRYLLQVFESVLLPTHASSHVQFLFFYFCSFRQGIVDSFVDALWRRFINPNTPAVVRQTTASYMASFVARANYLPASTVNACLDLMVSWIHCYINNQESASRFSKEVKVHGPFYSLCQAVLYIFVYRHKQLLENNKGLHYIMSLNLERVVTCRLNPLKVCLPSVVNIFATLARKFQVAFCYTVMEHNARSKLPVFKLNTFGSGAMATPGNPLDSFFPFDPYVLPQSGVDIEKLYRHWEGCKPDFSGLEPAVDDSEDEEEFMQYESVDKDIPLGLTPTSAACISPGFRSPSSFGR
ncbi:RNA polymerase I-specific transcription initiation factor RRN3 [Strongylocentrotus purpuratus]|uniref:RNA polymerase I-specific transcription initiation factor RRN3 n=1 Tax=Strongylocentrotus purpuratus TaxID=7668 RepID=A0A7M7NQG6_STRPU|nr:RNA polymerase I-specific transcription initiation factor RRN3 [Strongylocentrotus purpuratus]